MKAFILLSVALCSLNAMAFNDSSDRDPIELYKSWCDSNNVMQSAANGQSTVAQNCASSQQICILNQRTQGHYVIYTASCQDDPRHADKGDPRDRSDK